MPDLNGPANRVFNISDSGAYMVERRFEGRCNCKQKLLPALTDRLGDIQDLHAGANGTCPSHVLQVGRCRLKRVDLLLKSMLKAPAFCA